MLTSNLNAVKHVYHHLALAASKLEAKKLIQAAIVKSSKVEKPKKPTKAELKKKELLNRIKKKLTSIETRIFHMEEKDIYDANKLFKLQLRVELMKKRIEKMPL